ncbi:MAG: hypothetical protein WCP35_18860 [Verrucomicrobiota bacterium]
MVATKSLSKKILVARVSKLCAKADTAVTPISNTACTTNRAIRNPPANPPSPDPKLKKKLKSRIIELRQTEALRAAFAIARGLVGISVEFSVFIGKNGG